ncbi:HNH endonuclease family protein [Gordonia soli]|uniref:HNH endonuclease family protein n=1 Tax=Gordonia soli TaxID=320799 RepID=UPI0034E2BE9E
MTVGTVAAATVSVLPAVSLMPDDSSANPARAAAARDLAGRLATLPVVVRSSDHSYERTAFGQSWSDDAQVLGAGNGCDTRNDILARDLADIRTAPSARCPTTVVAGEFRSPYSGEFVSFRRGRGSAEVQIDHIVPLSYAWDMGASTWTAIRRLDFANDPANLVAVDAASNQAKSDKEPARWMPRQSGFHCQYAMQFVAVSAAYGLAVDGRSRPVLDRALHRC